MRIKRINKTNSKKNFNTQTFMHNHTSHDTLHQIYVLLFESRNAERKRVLHSIKALERLSGRKRVIQINQSFQIIPNPNRAGFGTFKFGLRGVSPI